MQAGVEQGRLGTPLRHQPLQVFRKTRWVDRLDVRLRLRLDPHQLDAGVEIHRHGIDGAADGPQWGLRRRHLTQQVQQASTEVGQDVPLALCHSPHQRLYVLRPTR